MVLHDLVKEHLCHKWPRICSTCCMHFPVLSTFIAYHRACSQITGVQLRLVQVGLCINLTCVDEVGRWDIRWALVDDKPERLLDTLHAANRDLYSAIYSIINILLTMPVLSAINKIYFQCNGTREILLKVGYTYTYTCASRLGYDY